MVYVEIYGYVFLFVCSFVFLSFTHELHKGIQIESPQSGELQDPSLSSMICLAGYVMITFLPFLVLCSVPGSSFVLSMLSLGAGYAFGILYRELSPLLGDSSTPAVRPFFVPSYT